MPCSGGGKIRVALLSGFLLNLNVLIMSSILASSSAMPPFHLAFPVHDLAAARRFYGELLGCPEGRSSPEWIDFNFYGHQIVAHLAPGECTGRPTRPPPASAWCAPRSGRQGRGLG